MNKVNLRNQFRVLLTLCLVFLTKVLQTPWLLEHTYLLPVNTSAEDIDLTQAANMPITCKIMSMADHILMTTLMFYLAGLSVYMFCRYPNPPISAASEETLKVNSLFCLETSDTTSIVYSFMGWLQSRRGSG